MSLVVFQSRSTRFEMVHQEVSRSTRIRPSFGKLVRVCWLSSVSHRVYPHPFAYSYAIKGSPNQKLLLEDIYYAIESRVCGSYRLTWRRAVHTFPFI
jgi:hypothetical protein